MLSSCVITRFRVAGLLTSQLFCGESRTRPPLAPPRRSELRNVEAEAQAVETKSWTLRLVSMICCFSAAISFALMSG